MCQEVVALDLAKNEIGYLGLTCDLNEDMTCQILRTKEQNVDKIIKMR